jgi:hypothetical protein
MCVPMHGEDIPLYIVNISYAVDLQGRNACDDNTSNERAYPGVTLAEQWIGAKESPAVVRNEWKAVRKR